MEDISGRTPASQSPGSTPPVEPASGLDASHSDPLRAHTPGPWLQEHRTVYALNERGTNRFTAHVDAGWEHGYLSAREDKRTSDGELVANARLIAAAPDLLAAIRNGAYALSYALSLVPDDDVLVPKMLRNLEAMQRAIAKATGADGDTP